MSERTTLTLLMQPVGWVEGPYFIDPDAVTAAIENHDRQLWAEVARLTAELDEARALLDAYQRGAEEALGIAAIVESEPQPDPPTREQRLAWAQGMCGWVSDHGKTLCILEPGHDPRHPPSPERGAVAAAAAESEPDYVDPGPDTQAVDADWLSSIQKGRFPEERADWYKAPAWHPVAESEPEQ